VLIRRVSLAYLAQGPLGERAGWAGVGVNPHRLNLVKLIKGGSSPVTMAQGNTQANVQTDMEEKRIVKSLIKDVVKKLEKVYDKIIIVGASIGREVEEKGYWDIYEEMEYVEKNVKDAWVELRALADADTEEEAEEEVKEENDVDRINSIFEELAAIYEEKIIYLTQYVAESKLYEYFGIENARIAIWHAIMGLANVLYRFAIRSC
jgi:hypothetical protein